MDTNTTPVTAPAVADDQMEQSFDIVARQDQAEAEIQSLRTDVDEVKARLDKVSRAASRPAIGGGTTAQSAEVKGFVDGYLRRGRETEVKSINGAAPQDGGFAVPQKIDEMIASELVEISPIRAIAQVVQTGTSGYRKLVATGGTASGWVSEVAPRPETDTPNCLVKLPDSPGIWLVKNWEWSNLGVELGLDRVSPEIAGELASDAGASNTASDNPITQTEVFAFEVPPENNANPSDRTLLAAATSQGAGWRGAALFVEQGTALVETGSTGNARAIAGTLSVALGSSQATHIESNAEAFVQLSAPDLAFPSTDVSGLANGANRMMIGNELVQFLNAQSLGNGNWRLSGLLRGRAGTEPAAFTGHPAGTSVVLLDDRPISLDPALVPGGDGVRIAAIGLADEDPVFSTLQNTGLSRRAIMPVSPRARVLADGTLHLCWTRRARGQWTWPEGVEVPLVEEQELYTVGYGSLDAPFAAWAETQPEFLLAPSERSALVANHGPAQLWVKQIGSYGESPALLLTTLS